MSRYFAVASCLSSLCVTLAWGVLAQQKDVPYVPTPMEVVDEMLKIVKVTKNDYVIDLGCGDGRIVVTAARRHGARGLGVDIDEERVIDSLNNVRKARVEKLVMIRRQNLFETDLSQATIVTLYLLPSVNMRLRPKLFRELQPGVRVVSHDFDMGDWEPESKVEVGKDGRHTLYFWVMPTGVGGTWRGEAHSLRLRQQLQKINGSIIDERRQEVPISEAKLVGDQLTFGALTTSGKLLFEGRIKDDRIEGSVRTEGAASNDKREWKVARQPYEIAGTWRWTVPRQETPIPGGLRIRREKNHFAATYLAGNEEVPLPTGGDERNYFIAQGASVMFEVSLKNGTSFKYNGLVDGDRITGTVSTGFSSLAREWSAQRTDK